jgi:outer membrane protein
LALVGMTVNMITWSAFFKRLLHVILLKRSEQMKMNGACPNTIRAIFCILIFTSTCLAESLEDAWRISLDHDYRLKAARESVAAAEESLSAAKSVRFPALKGEATYARLNQTPEAEISLPYFPSLTAPLLKDDSFLVSDLTVSIPVFTSGRISHGIDSAAFTVKANQEDAYKTAQDVKLQVAETYVSVLRALKMLDVAQSSVRSLTAHETDVTRMFQEGLVSKNDVLAVSVALVDARQTVLQVENKVDMAKAAYNRLLKRPLSDAVDLDDLNPAFLTDIASSRCYDDLVGSALENRSEIKGLSNLANAYHAGAKSIKASALPQILASGSFYHFDQMILADNNYWEAGLVLRWDIFDGGVIRHKARAEERKQLAVENQKMETESLIELQVRQAWLDTQETAKRIGVSEQALNQAEENLKVTRNRYAQELGNNTEVLDAETLRIKSRTNYTQAVYDAILADIRLRRAIGNL